MKKQIFIIASVLFAITGQAQHHFRVLVSVGTNSLVETNQKLLVGASLKNNQKVKVSFRGYLSLVHQSGGTVQISKPGVYSIADLEKKLQAQPKSLTSKYTTYIVAELRKKSQKNINIHRTDHMKVAGSVKRMTINRLRIYLPEASNFYSPRIPILWTKLTGYQHYVLKIIDEFEEEVLYTQTFQDTVAIVDFNQPRLKNVKTFIVIVEAKEREIQSDSYALFRLEQPKRSRFEKACKVFKNGSAIKDKVAQKIAEAFFFERNECYIDAWWCYKEAIKMSHNTEAYTIAFKQFLLRYNMAQVLPGD